MCQCACSAAAQRQASQKPWRILKQPASSQRLQPDQQTALPALHYHTSSVLQQGAAGGASAQLNGSNSFEMLHQQNVLR